MNARVVVTDYALPDLDRERDAARCCGATFSAHQCRSDEEVAGAVEGAAVVAVQFATFGPRSARAVRPGASVIRYGVGYDNIDLAAASEAGLRLGYVPDYCTEEVADHTAAAILTLLRKLAQLDRSVRAGDWAAVRHAAPLKPLAETTVGFFGLGQIGRRVLARLRAFGLAFIAADPGVSASEADALGVRLVGPERLLEESDVLSLHASATPETRGFLNAASLRRMRPHAFVVNSARGTLIREADLADALREGTIAGAALDVFDEEPLPEGSPLRTAPNVILTPHAAWYSDAAIGRLQRRVADDIRRALQGELPRRPVPGFPGGDALRGGADA